MTKRAARAPAARVRPMGPRVVLRPLVEADLPSIEPWYPEAAERLAAAQADADADLLTVARRDDPTPIGLIDFRTGQPAPGWLTICLIVVAAPYRGHGYGSEAVLLLEDDALRRGAAGRFRADVSMSNGLGIYFWLRLGYRPARPEERFWPASAPADVVSMVRTP